jgi:hypothetical protein
MGQTAISCTDRRQASPEARPHLLTESAFKLGTLLNRGHQKARLCGPFTCETRGIAVGADTPCCTQCSEVPSAHSRNQLRGAS